MIAPLLTKLEQIRLKDERIKYDEFYATFGLQEIYSASAIFLILKGERNPKNPNFIRFLNTALEVFDEWTEDLSWVQPLEIREMLDEYNDSHNKSYDLSDCARQTDMTISGVTRCTKVKTPATLVLYDLLSLDLFSNDLIPHTLTNNVKYYDLIKRRIMRALVADGTYRLTIEDLAKQTGLEEKDLKHPERLCRDRDRYFDAYDKIVHATKPYNVNAIAKKLKP